MLRFSSSYTEGNANFVIQNLTIPYQSTDKRDPFLAILKNILQRGKFLKPSVYLQTTYNLDFDLKKSLSIKMETPLKWHQTIKGDEQTGYTPAREFLEEVWKQQFPDHAWVQQLLLPECPIQDIFLDVGIVTDEWEHQAVDFYLSPLKLVVEIDGGTSQGLRNQAQDVYRVNELQKIGVQTVRITTNELRAKNPSFQIKMDYILSLLRKSDQLLDFKSQAEYDEETIQLAAISRWQLFILSLLEAEEISFKDTTWSFEIKSDIPIEFIKVATKDLLNWANALHQLQKGKRLRLPKLHVNRVEEFSTSDVHCVDFKLFQQYSDEYKTAPNYYFIRSDYLMDADHYEVSSADPVTYHFTDEGSIEEKALKFFLKNLFNFSDFQEGQLQIIKHSLNGNHCIGLLPTGSGKSLCYQIAAILQPCISYVVVPIISLMQDQEHNLNKFGFDRVTTLSSAIDAGTKKVRQTNFGKGKYQLIIISPERFQTKEFRERLRIWTQTGNNRQLPRPSRIFEWRECAS